MTDTAGPQPDATPETQPPARTIVQTLVRALASSAVLVTVYYLLPLDHSSHGSPSRCW
jgi:voltage-gated potassium channel